MCKIEENVFVFGDSDHGGGGIVSQNNIEQLFLSEKPETNKPINSIKDIFFRSFRV